jgi:hypothetical protein
MPNREVEQPDNHDYPEALTREEMMAGAPCPGCGVPLHDGLEREWRRIGTLNYSDAQRVAADAEENAFRERHPDCYASRWSVGDGPTHCAKCCPPHPFSDDQIAMLARLLYPPST